MIAYNDILYYGNKLNFKYNSDIFFVDDIYCVKDGCGCKEVFLEILKVDENDDEKIYLDENLHLILYNYKTSAYKIEQENHIIPEVKILIAELLKTIPTLSNKLKKRHSRLKTLYKNYLIREGININTSQNNDTRSFNINKTGRNELCLCGSGKKYKKCCMMK